MNKETAKYYYDYCENNKWSYKKIKELAERINVDHVYVIQGAKKYAKVVLKIDNIDEVVDDITAEYMRDYCDKCSWDPIRISKNCEEEFGSRYDVVMSIGRKREKDKLLNKIKAKDKTVNQETMKETMKEKKFYSFYGEYKSDKKKIKEYAKSHDISDDELVNLIRNFNRINHPTNQRDSALEASHRRSPGNMLLDSLMKTSDQEEIKELTKDWDTNKLKNLYSRVYDYVRLYHNDVDVDETVKKLQNVLKDIINKRNIGVSKADTIADVTKIVEKFIDSDLTAEDYAKEEGITVARLNQYIKILEPDLYKKYTNRIRYNQSITGKESDPAIEIMLECLKDGVYTNDGSRPYDVIDHYRLTHMSPSDATRIAVKMFKDKDLALIQKFAKRISEDVIKDFDLERLMGTNVEKECKRDEDGMPIPGSGVLISKKDKENAIKWLKEEDIPITETSFVCALDRQFNGTFNDKDVIPANKKVGKKVKVN